MGYTLFAEINADISAHLQHFQQQPLSELDQPERGQQQQCQQQGRCEFEHEVYQRLAEKLFAVLRGFIRDGLAALYPAYEYAGAYSHHRHEYVVGDIVEDIEYLSAGTVGR